MQIENAACWLNGKIVPTEQAVISVYDHGLLYGDGVFEGIRFYHHNAFRLDEHLQRLQDSASALNIHLPYTHDDLVLAVTSLIEESEVADGYIRLIVTRGVGSLGVDPSHCGQPTVVMMSSSLSIVSAEKRRQGLRIMIVGTRRLSVDVLDARIKSLNYLNNVMAKIQANIAGMDEAIMLNAAGFITEGSADNIFVVKNGELVTPDSSSGALEGITRNLMIELARQNDLPVRETRLTAYDLYTADECFLTGTGAELLPVAEVDGRKMKDSSRPVYQLLESAFQKTIQEETA